MFVLLIDKSSKYVFYFDWQVKLIIAYLEDFLSSAEPLLNHATIAWFSFFKNKTRQGIAVSFIYI